MDGDEKHPRELIESARHQYVLARKLSHRGTDAQAHAPLALAAAMTPERLAALEATLPGDDDWEYRYAEIYGHDTYTRGPGDGLWFETTEGARANRVEESDVIVRRRKPGPVEILPEPVEKVPRG